MHTSSVRFEKTCETCAAAYGDVVQVYTAARSQLEIPFICTCKDVQQPSLV